MSSMGRKEGIVEGEEEPYVTVPAAVLWCVVCGPSCWGLERAPELAEVCGRVNSSKRSARRGWCMWMYVTEESLLWCCGGG